MKKILSILLISMLCLGLSACGGNKASTNSTTSDSDTQGSKELSIGFTTSQNDDDPYYVTAREFKKLVEEKSEGRLVINIFPSSQLGSEPEMWEGMQVGTCDMAVMTNAYVSSFVPANGVLDLPFIFPNLDVARGVLDGEFGEKLANNLEGTGIKLLSWSEGGFRQVCTREKAIKAPEDMVGLKIRCMETKTYLSAYAALGVNATPMAWGELLTALQQGTVDGCDAPLSVLYTNGFPDICKYINNINLFYSPLPVCISQNVFDSLSPEDQEIIMSSAVEAAKLARENNDTTATRMEEELEAQGMTIIKEDEVNLKAFQEAAQGSYEEMEKYIGTEWYEGLKAVLK